jgi:hypothetical protein
MRITQKRKRSVTGWKAALVRRKQAGGGTAERKVLVKLRIPSHAAVRWGDDKCRASEAQVIRVETLEGQQLAFAYTRPGESTLLWRPERRQQHVRCSYRVGTVVQPHGPFNLNPRRGCASGIHFFRTRQEAITFGDVYYVTTGLLWLL